MNLHYWENPIQNKLIIAKSCVELKAGYNTEKDIILSMLQSADTQKLIERERQLVLTKLRRDKQRIKREQKYHGAALVFGLAYQNQAKKEER